ncbi:hypothetical protein ABZ845_25370 [Streptomyces sp. NPDC047022]|uniref:hypothetical protein n=1 Tax=Streptomyces sp. NPDC047022 TaxID=3155737 RepID=UPI0033DF4353
MSMSAFLPVLVIGGGALLGFAGRQMSKRGKHFTRAQLQAFATDLRRELYARSHTTGEWIDVTDYLRQQPYFPGTWFLSVYRILHQQGITHTPTPRSTPGGGARIRLSDKGVEEARMERIVSAAEQPRTVNNYQAGVMQIGDHNQAREVTTHFGADQSALLSQLITALSAVARNTELQPQVREAAERAGADLEGAEPSRIPVILERLRGIASVAATGFETVRPILDALGSVL